MNYDLLAFYTGVLSTIEVGLGSLLHGIRVPFSGQFLSLNQIFILALMNKDDPNPKYPGLVSTCSALLKTLSPAGKKLTPMLAISMQGQLFSLGVYIFGSNIMGRIVGAILSGLWAFIQPLLLYLIIFGKELIDVYQYFFAKVSKVFDVNESIFIEVVLGLVITKVFLSILIVLIAQFIKNHHFERYQSWVNKFKKSTHSPHKKATPLKGALKDILNPFFIFTMVLTVIFFFFAKSSLSQSIWFVLRPLTIAFILFYLLRKYPLQNSIDKMPNNHYKKILEKVISKLQ